MPALTLRPTLALALLTLAAGCNPYTRLPRLGSPGNTASQQLESIYHDPYPLDDAGPEVVGGRPLAYARPAPEVVRGRLLRGNQTVVPSGTVGAPMMFAVPPTAAPQVVTPPGTFVTPTTLPPNGATLPPGALFP